MARVYFAAPLFCVGERAFNAEMAALLEQAGYAVFLPQRDGMMAATLTGLSEEEKIERIFARDLAEIKASDILLIVLDGRVPDEGACVELGIAHTLGKRCYALSTDDRALELDLKVNPLIAGCCRRLFSGTAELKEFLQTETL